ncbi:hypothetical protein [Salinicola rhizosphaerae]|uniref:BON domain-containing protein n=1 Tax=Salinicola rhizosphaerae TaxID=1443141 RepID=A0ABQ3DQH0_9GAMM|nr:hypothetical protein [Salinicola rhizosphaerae]GHB09530.1 hypothetical protein GCM10009038_03950 [Salinicola rhizosphaerae]
MRRLKMVAALGYCNVMRLAERAILIGCPVALLGASGGQPPARGGRARHFRQNSPLHEETMAQISLTLKGVTTPEDLNRLTSALMMVDGVDSVDIGREWAEVEGRVDRVTLIRAVAAVDARFSAE